MGGEVSKLQAPEEFGQSGNQFQIVSPVSDLSCPSDIHRIQRLRSQQQLRGPVDPSRRMSKTVTKSLSNKQHSDAVPAPARFYFPTKETERAVEQAERRNMDMEKAEDNNNKENKILQKTKKVSKKVLKKTHKAMKKTHMVMQGCFADEQAVEVMEAAQQKEESKHHPTLGIARKIVPQKSGKHVSKHAARPERRVVEDEKMTPIALKQERPTHVGYDVPLTQKKGNDDNKAALENSNHPNILTHPALHQADDYFSRLTGGASEVSPYVENKAMLKALPSALGPEEPDSPVSNLFDDNVSMKSPESSLNESDVQRRSHSISSNRSEGSFNSPSASVLAYQKAIGTVAETPGYYPENFNEDEESYAHEEEKRSQKTAEDLVNEITEMADRALTTISEKADDETPSIVLPKKSNADTAFRSLPSQSKSSQNEQLPVADIQNGRRNVSKLESLFRPVMPALSADDGQTYDPWEIKVTESAPSVLEGNSNSRRNVLQKSDSREMTPLEKKLEGRQDRVSRSTETQTSLGMISNQASRNGDFLFAGDGKMVLAKSESHSEVPSINTQSSRNRLHSRPRTDALVVPKSKELVLLYDQSQISKDASSRVRFSLLDAVSASVGLAPKESIDVPTIESRMSDLTEAPLETTSLETVPLTASKAQWSYKNDRATPFRRGNETNGSTYSPYLRFKSAKDRFQTQASIDVHDIQSKVSDLTEDRRATTESSESVHDVQSEIVSGEAQQMHWSYNAKNGDISAATPHYGKAAPNSTKSPTRRYEDAKHKFGATEGILIKKETNTVKNKALPVKSPRSQKFKQNLKIRPMKSGGSVASKIEALNQRVVDAKIDRKMHRWTKSNPRKYGVTESNAVRTRAIVQYKTDVASLEKFNYMSAAKFNSIPIEDDDSTVGSCAGNSRYSKKSVSFADQKPLLHSGNQEPEYDDDEVSKLSAGDMSKLTTDSHSTVQQNRPYMPNMYSRNARASESTYSTTSTGVGNIKKQIFRGSSSTAGRSTVSHEESTTMSSILEKENANLPSFRSNAKTVQPINQSNVTNLDLHLSPGPAQKWRSLAAAAQSRDAKKKPVNENHLRKGLKLKNRNMLQAYGY